MIVLALSALAPTSEDGWIGQWSPGVGDPTLAAWLIVIAYVVAAVLCWRAAQRVGAQQRLERMWWVATSTALWGLGINKQLDLQTALTELGRMVTVALDIVSLRWLLRWSLVAVLALAALAVGTLLLRMTRRAPRPTRTAVLGVIGLMTFIVLRASVLYRVGGNDEFLSAALFTVLEALPLLTICIGAIGRTRTPMAPGAARQISRR